MTAGGAALFGVGGALGGYVLAMVGFALLPEGGCRVPVDPPRGPAPREAAEGAGDPTAASDEPAGRRHQPLAR